MDAIKQFFIFLSSSWWGILLIVAASIIVWLVLSALLYRPFFKRFYDIVFSIVGLPFFLLLFIPIAIAIKTEDKGPVFYCGERLGKKGKTFKMFKFRSMKQNAPDIRLADGSTYNSENDPRVTRIGKFLRKTSLDEIPQILNIFLGHMSFIGPRPDLPDAMEKYSETERVRLKMRPGITGYNQAYYRNSIEWKQRVENDVFYVKKCSMLFDIRIFFKTFISVIFKKNINVSAQAIQSIEENIENGLTEQIVDTVRSAEEREANSCESGESENSAGDIGKSDAGIKDDVLAETPPRDGDTEGESAKTQDGMQSGDMQDNAQNDV